MRRAIVIAAAVAVGMGPAMLLSASAASTVEVVSFATPQQENLYRKMLTELRCLVCANQSLSDSNAELAKDLRGKVQKMVAHGQNRAAIVAYMTNRYGEYILYRPRFSGATLLLWVSPLLLLLLGLAAAVRLVARKSSRSETAYSAAQLQKVGALLKDELN